MDTAEAQERDAARREGRRAARRCCPCWTRSSGRWPPAPAIPSSYEGVAAIQRLFMRALREAGAEAVESVAGKQGS